MSIIALLAAIVLPALSSSQRQARRTVCLSNLHQIWAAIELYRIDSDGDARYGTSFEMGLPPRVAEFSKGGLLPEAILKVTNLKCAEWPSKFDPSFYSYNFMYQDPEQLTTQNRWDKYSEAFQEQSILITDVNHNDADIPLYSTTISKRGVGVTIGGSLVKQYKPGDFDILPWWTTSCTTECPL